MFDPKQYKIPKESLQDKVLKAHGYHLVRHACRTTDTWKSYHLEPNKANSEYSEFIYPEPGERIKDLCTRLGWYDPDTKEIL